MVDPTNLTMPCVVGRTCQRKTAELGRQVSCVLGAEALTCPQRMPVRSNSSRTHVSMMFQKISPVLGRTGGVRDPSARKTLRKTVRDKNARICLRKVSTHILTSPKMWDGLCEFFYAADLSQRESVGRMIRCAGWLKTVSSAEDKCAVGRSEVWQLGAKKECKKHKLSRHTSRTRVWRDTEGGPETDRRRHQTTKW